MGDCKFQASLNLCVELTPSAKTVDSVFKLVPVATIFAFPTTDNFCGLSTIESSKGKLIVLVAFETDLALFG